MSHRTLVIGDIHGELSHLERIFRKAPVLGSGDHIVFLGDYLNRGPDSRKVVERLMNLPAETKARVVCLRGNHEDAWLRVRAEGWDAFVRPPAHGCLATYRSFLARRNPLPDEPATAEEWEHLRRGDFFPQAVVDWMEKLPFWFEDEHGVYVHAGLPRAEQGFAHPSEVANPHVLAWLRTDEFVRTYTGKNVFFGHTPTSFLPQDLSQLTPNDPSDAYVTDDCFGLDTGCGMGGFLSAMLLPEMRLYESR